MIRAMVSHSLDGRIGLAAGMGRTVPPLESAGWGAPLSGPQGQKTRPPRARSIAGVKVRHANSVMKRHRPIAGPLLRNLPNSAKNIIDNPTMMVSALAA